MLRALTITALFSATALAPSLAPSLAMAAPPATANAAAYNTPFADQSGRAASGYDVVSYFDGKPAKGDARFFTDRAGARYLFASAANKARFDAAPAKFQPQYDGYCAYGASRGYKAPIEPQTGVVIGGKLYFNYNDAVAVRFNKDRAGYIAKANANWTRIKNDAPVQ